MKKLGPKAKQELVVLVKNSLGRFKTGQALFFGPARERQILRTRKFYYFGN